MMLFTVAQKGGFHLSAKPAEAMGGEYIPYDFKPAMNYWF